MEKRSLPLNFYCRSARLLLKKASFSRKSNLLAEELRHLKKFSTLAFSVIPSHPEYEDERGRKLAEDLEECMDDVRERIEELQEELSSTCSTNRPTTDVTVKHETHEKRQQRQHVWARLARRLYDAATCFTKKAGTTKRLVSSGQYSGASQYTKYPFIRNVSEVESEDGQSNRSVEDDENDDEDRHFAEIRSKELVLSRREESGSSETGSTTRTQLLTQMAEANNLNMEGKLLNIQTIVMDLRDSVESLRSRVEEEGKRWRGRAESLERKLKGLKDETENDLMNLKTIMNDSDQKKNLEQKLEKMETAGEVVDFKNQVNQFITVTKAGLEDRFSDLLSEVKSDLRNDINSLEIGLSKDVDNLRQEMASRYESLLIDVEMGKIGGQQQLNSIMKQQQGGELKAGTQTSDVNKHLEILRSDIHAARRDFDKLTEGQRTERAQLRKQLQSTRQEAMEARVDTEVWIKQCELQVNETRHSLIEVRGEQDEMKADLELLKKQQSDKECYTKSDVTVGGGKFPLEFASNLLMVERVEKLSKLYTGCLDDLQARVCCLEAVNKPHMPEETVVALIEKERSLATSAASEAIAAASRTKEMLQDALRTVMSHILSSKEETEITNNELKLNKSLRARIQRLNRQMRQVFEKLTSTSNKKVTVQVKSGFKKDGKHSNEMIISNMNTIDHKLKTAAGILSQLEQRIQRLETVQTGLRKSIEDVGEGNRTLEKAANFWLPKYESTANLVMEMQSRLHSIEQQQQMQRQQEQPQPGTEIEKSDGLKSELYCLERLLALEDRVDHIASATYTNLRLLDAKVEHASIGMRSALDIATETEDKCSNLGAELVKVFRLILSAKDSPRKPDSRGGESPISRAERGPQTSKLESSETTIPAQPYNSLPTKPVVKRLSLKVGEKGTIVSKIPM